MNGKTKMNTARLPEPTATSNTPPRNPVCGLMIHDFPRNVKNRFAAMCALEGKTLKDGVIKLMVKALRERGM